MTTGRSEPNELANLLTICAGELSNIARRLYEMEEEDTGSLVDDAAAMVEEARRYCKGKRL